MILEMRKNPEFWIWFGYSGSEYLKILGSCSVRVLWTKGSGSVRFLAKPGFSFCSCLLGSGSFPSRVIDPFVAPEPVANRGGG